MVFFEDKYGKRGTQFGAGGMPTYSIPIEIFDAPSNTQSFALVLEDKDAVSAAGYVWVHWLVAIEDASISSIYGGMAPPNCDHRYELYAYALDCDLDLSAGFGFNELHFAMQGHILAEAYLMGIYKQK